MLNRVRQNVCALGHEYFQVNVRLYMSPIMFHINDKQLRILFIVLASIIWAGLMGFDVALYLYTYYSIYNNTVQNYMFPNETAFLFVSANPEATS